MSIANEVSCINSCILFLQLFQQQSRARVTGRVVPTSLLEETMEQVPKSVSVLKTKADFFVEFHNDGDGDDVKIVQPEYLDWQGFTRQWAPLCEESSVVNIMT